MDVTLYKKVNVRPGVAQNITLNYNCALVDDIPPKADQYPTADVHAFVSSPFKFNGQNCLLEDDGNGNVRLVTTDGITNQKVSTVGTINYATGEVNIVNVTIDTYTGNSVKFYVRPRDVDVSTKRNTILNIETDEIHVTPEQLRL
jgi:hypothetical protein